MICIIMIYKNYEIKLSKFALLSKRKLFVLLVVGRKFTSVGFTSLVEVTIVLSIARRKFSMTAKILSNLFLVSSTG